MKKPKESSLSERTLNNLVLRTLTGAIYVIAVIGSIFLGSYVFLLLFFIINGLVIREFLIIMGKGLNKPINVLSGIVCGSLLYLLFSLVALNLIGFHYIFLSLALPVFLMLSALFKKEEYPIMNVAIILFSIIYISIPFSLLNLLFVEQNPGGLGFPWILAGLFVVLWVNDTFAYLTGLLIGKHKLFERISPKKTWEGTLGGLVFSILTGVFFYYFSASQELWKWITMSALIAVSGDFGDLFESMIKRSFNIKDSGSALPGHGGLLDRFDSLLIAVPVVTVYLTLIN